MKKIVSVFLLLSTFALFGDSQENRCACSKPRPKKQKPKQTKQVGGDVDNSQELSSADRPDIVNEGSVIESSEPTKDSRCGCSRPRPKQQKPKENKAVEQNLKDEEQKQEANEKVESCECTQSTGSCECAQSNVDGQAVTCTCLAAAATEPADQSSCSNSEQK